LPPILPREEGWQRESGRKEKKKGANQKEEPYSEAESSLAPRPNEKNVEGKGRGKNGFESNQTAWVLIAEPGSVRKKFKGAKTREKRGLETIKVL